MDNVISKSIYKEPIRDTACFGRNDVYVEKLNSSLNVLSALFKYQSEYEDCALSYIMVTLRPRLYEENLSWVKVHPPYRVNLSHACSDCHAFTVLTRLCEA